MKNNCQLSAIRDQLRTFTFSMLLSLALLGCANTTAARVLRVEISSRQDVLDGQPFGDVGPYERITGKVYFAVAVSNRHNRRIVDLDKAVNLKNGEAEFSSDFVVARPKEMKRGNGSMLI